ncbi:MAG: hypothetical protein ABSF82_08545 [Candidatus Bathyarchaeia archaeon]|jgi:hypothetical protein
MKVERIVVEVVRVDVYVMKDDVLVVLVLVVDVEIEVVVDVAEIDETAEVLVVVVVETKVCSGPRLAAT